MAGSGLVAAVTMFVTLAVDPAALVLASVTAVPPVPLLACLGIGVAALPAFLASPAASRARGAARTETVEVAA